MTSSVPATSGMLSTRRRVWLARGVMFALVVLFVVLKTCDLGAVHAVHDGQRTVYSGSHLLSILFACFAVLVFIVGLLFWMQPRRSLKAMGLVLFMTSLGFLCFAPTGWNHCVIVTADGFFDRVGFWLGPRERTVDFKALRFMDLQEVDSPRNDRRIYVLRCYPKGGEELITIRLDDNLTAALPEIFRNAAKRGVTIGPNDQALEDLFGQDK